MDFLVGTMDKEDLDQHGWMLMDQQLWGKMGVSWVKDMAMGRTEMVCRSGWQLDQP